MLRSEKSIIITPVLRGLFEESWQQCRVIYFSAPCGLGKTAAAHALLAGRCVCALSAAEPNYLSVPISEDVEAVLIDDFQYINDPEDQQTLCTLINRNPGIHFIFLSRGVLPGWLMPYRLTGLLTIITTDALMFDHAAVRQLADAHGAALTDGELNALLAETHGYPLLLDLLCRRMAAGEPYGKALLDEGARELYHYVEDAVYHRFSPEMRRLLVSLSPFDGFDAELARLVSGNSRVNDLLGQILHETTMLSTNNVNDYSFHSIFREFLLWELEQECTTEEQRNIYRRAGLYYELRDDYAHALECYTKSGEHSKVSELLVKNVERQMGSAFYYDVERYYYALPREDVLRSPLLMSGMSMLTAICLDYEASEAWYAELQSYAARLQTTDANYKLARSRLLYLDIALPQRGSRGLPEMIGTALRIMTDEHLSIPTFSVTSCLPSIMNGSKDFCEWSRQDEELYDTMRLPVETLLGHDGVGLADCAICESKFEKGEDVSALLLTLMTRLGDIQRKGTPDIEFAAVGLLARIQVAQGRTASALETLENLRDSFVERGQSRFLPNLDAMRCRIWLRDGETAKAEQWLRESAPASVPRFRALWRYRYMTKAMCLIAAGAPAEALLCLAPLLPYCESCARVMDGLQLRLLMAVCHYRQRDGAWKAELCAALDTAAEYQLIMPVAQYGAAILPLLTECKWSGEREYFARVLAAARVQTVNYPDFLCPPPALLSPLTPAELQVLKLLCHNRSNQEIADILGVKLTTVKSQVACILQKLDVKRRSEAKDAALTLHLLK